MEISVEDDRRGLNSAGGWVSVGLMILHILCAGLTMLTVTLSCLRAADEVTEKRFVISDYGAVADAKTINTQAIQKAIDAAAVSGGLVVIPKGTFRSGSIF